MIQSVFIGDDVDLIAQLLTLHAYPRRTGRLRVLDLTYGHGGFWRGTRLSSEDLSVTGLDKRMESGALDLSRVSPVVDSLVAGDYTALPFAAASFDVVCFDPPFLTDRGGNGRIAQRYTAFASYRELLDSLAGARDEARRVLAPDGFAIVKVMDWTEGRKRRWLHQDTFASWTSVFRLDDEVVKVGVTNIRTTTIQRQERTKSAHTFFMVWRPILRRRTAREIETAPQYSRDPEIKLGAPIAPLPGQMELPV